MSGGQAEARRCGRREGARRAVRGGCVGLGAGQLSIPVSCGLSDSSQHSSSFGRWPVFLP